MTAHNVVRMRVKPGRNEDYLEAHRAIGRDTFAGMKSVAIGGAGALTDNKTDLLATSPLRDDFR